MKTKQSRTRVTPNHRVLARLRDEFFGQWVVYLMRRGRWWRVGICTSGHRPYKSGGVAGRLATEQADAGWVLAVCETREEAIRQEVLIQARYGLPGLTFEVTKQRALSRENVHQIHDQLASHTEVRAEELLADYGSDPAWPLYRRGKGWKKNMRSTFTIEAGTLKMLDGWVDLPVFVGKVKEEYLPATFRTEHYKGLVFGLEVPPCHHYVSGGAVVHNSVKGGQADNVILFPDLSPAADEEYWGPYPDPTVRLFYVAMTRARRDLIVCSSAGKAHVEIAQELPSYRRVRNPVECAVPF